MQSYAYYRKLMDIGALNHKQIFAESQESARKIRHDVILVPFNYLNHYVKDGVGYIHSYRDIYAKVDVEDFELLKLFFWGASGGSDKATSNNRHLRCRGWLMSDYLMDKDMNILRDKLQRQGNSPKRPRDMNNKVVVDHRNGDTLDNRKGNLRVCTFRENLVNRGKKHNTTSQFKGVYKRGGKWQTNFIAVSDTEEEAAKMWDSFAKIAHGPYARLNFPDD